MKKLVYVEDQNIMLKAGSVESIKKQLINQKTFFYGYHSSENRNCEMKFVKIGDDEDPQTVSLEFADKDEEIRAEVERKRIADRDMALISGLADDVCCVVYVDFTTYEEVHYRHDPLFGKHLSGWSEIPTSRCVSTAYQHPCPL